MTTYHARVERGDRFWLVHVPEVERTTQARHLREVETMARDLVAVMQGVEPDSFDLDVEISLPQSVRDIGQTLGVSFQRAHQLVS